VSGEEVRQDIGGWISGAAISTENVLAEDVEPGDKLLYDGRIVEVTDTRLGFYRFPEGRLPGTSIGWKAGNSSGLLFRRASDLLERVTSQP
jgi:hypothetical protein